MIKMFCAISEEETTVSGALSFYCRKGRVQGKHHYPHRAASQDFLLQLLEMNYCSRKA